MKRRKRTINKGREKYRMKHITREKEGMGIFLFLCGLFSDVVTAAKTYSSE